MSQINDTPVVETRYAKTMDEAREIIRAMAPGAGYGWSSYREYTILPFEDRYELRHLIGYCGGTIVARVLVGEAPEPTEPRYWDNESQADVLAAYADTPDPVADPDTDHALSAGLDDSYSGPLDAEDEERRRQYTDTSDTDNSVRYCERCGGISTLSGFCDRCDHWTPSDHVPTWRQEPEDALTCTRCGSGLDADADRPSGYCMTCDVGFRLTMTGADGTDGLTISDFPERSHAVLAGQAALRALDCYTGYRIDAEIGA
jgi:hypothetical protein